MRSDEKPKQVPGWDLAEGSLTREFKFKDFEQAFSFMTKVAAEAEKMNHHPDWSNSYNRVVIRLTSHDAGVVSDKDFALAARINELAGN